MPTGWALDLESKPWVTMPAPHIGGISSTPASSSCFQVPGDTDWETETAA